MRSCNIFANLAVVSALFLVACGESQDDALSSSQDIRRETIVQSRNIEAGEEKAAPEWLSPASSVSPDLWMASVEAEADLDESDPRVSEAARMLEAAAVRFSESQRMIANRTVQMATMLSERGIDEGPLLILEDLTEVASDRARKIPFGELCQHYYNFRVRGLDRITALGALETKYRRQ